MTVEHEDRHPGAVPDITLAEFLRACLDEEEQAARAATPGPWRWNRDGGSFDGEDRPLADPITGGWGHSGPDLVSDTATWTVNGHEYPESVVSSQGYDADNVIVKRADADHIARHDPARVLREVEAKRRIVAMHEHDHSCVDETGIDDYAFTGPPRYVHCVTMRLLALQYADHPGYRAEEWAS